MAQRRPSGSGNDERSPLLGGQVDADEAVDHVGEDVVADAAPAAIPKVQVALLCAARLLEPIAFFCIFPYINQMVQDNGGVPDTDVGFYSGLIESLFSLTQALVMFGWGRAADRVGRKPVLVLSLVGVAGATALFGLARSLVQMVVFRCLAGVFAGTIVTIRTMLAEHSTPATQARVFSWFAFSGNLGIFLGPLLGGALADPLRLHGHHPAAPAVNSSSSSEPFFAAYPYALPGFVVSGLGLLSAVLCALFVEETLVRRPAPPGLPRPAGEGNGSGEGGGQGGEVGDGGAAAEAAVTAATSAVAADMSVRDLLRAPGVGMVLYAYAHTMLLAFSYTALSPVYWFTPVALGGLGFTPVQISLLMGINGAAQALWLLFAFPALQHRMGTNGVMRLCAHAYPFFLGVIPLAGLWLRRWGGAFPDDGGPRPVFWAVFATVLAIGCGVSMCFTAVQLAVNDVAPSPQVLGTLNALALTGVSMIRAVTPALFTSLYALGARTQLLDGYAIWLLMVALGVAYVAVVRQLPDYEALKKQRGERMRS